MRPEGGAAVKELGVGKGGKLGATGGTLLTQYLMRAKVHPHPLPPTPISTTTGHDAIG